jgi:TolB protein
MALTPSRRLPLPSGALVLLVWLGCLISPAGADGASTSGAGDHVIAYSITPPNGNNEIFTIRADGSDRQQLTSEPGRDAGPAWSPDASRIAFYAHWPDETTWSIYVMDADGSNLGQLTNTQGVWDNSPAWSPDGDQIAFAREYPTQGYRAEVWVMNADGSDSHQIASTLGSGPEWSPDGSEIVFYSDRDGNSEIYVMDADGANIRRLTDTPAPEYWPDWSPDGTQIVFRSDRDGNAEIYKMDADGSDPVRLTDHSAEDSRPDWSPDGSEIAWSSFRDGNYEIYLMSADGTNQRRLTTTSVHAIQPDWKPDSSATTEAGPPGTHQKGVRLIGAVPNPFVGSSVVSFSVDRPRWIRITLYDVTGRRIASLADGVFGAGTHSVSWGGQDDHGRHTAPGSYLARLESEGRIETAKIVVAH